MHQRDLAEVRVSAIGLGSVALGTAEARGVFASDLERIVHEGLAAGLSLVIAGEPQTSEEDRRSAERLCGAAVRGLGLRDRVVLVSRVALAPAPSRDLRGKLPSAHVQQEVEASLRAIKLDALPLVIVPLALAWIAEPGFAELVAMQRRLTREGKVMRWAVQILDRTFGEDALVAARQLTQDFVACEVVYNACQRQAEPMFELGLPIVASEPLAGGALAGKLGPGIALGLRDDRRTIAQMMLERIAVTAARIAPWLTEVPTAARSCDAAREALERTTRHPDPIASTLPELMLRFALLPKAIATPRIHSVSYLTEALTAGSAPPLPADVRAAIAELFA